MIRFFKFLCAIILISAAPARAAPGEFGIGLSGPVDWSTAQPFLDLMKSARPWIGHGTSDWQVMNMDEMDAAGALDEHGWPTMIPAGVDSIGTLVLTGLPSDVGGLAGRYVLQWTGSGEIDVDQGALNPTYGPNTIEFDWMPGRGPAHISIYSTDPQRTGDYIRDMTIVRKDRLAAHRAGEIFNPDWLALIDGFEVLRFMDWMETNDSTLAHWADRPEPADVSWRLNGVPVEIMIEIAHKTGAEPWFNIPHLADDDFVRNFAAVVNEQLDPSIRAWVEFSNEVWNWSFDQAHWADEQAQKTWVRDPRYMQFYAGRATEVVDIWTEVFGDEADDRLVRVISTQTGWLGLEQEVLHATKWVKKERGRTAPGEHFDAYAITGYFGGHLARGDWAAPVLEWIEDSKAAAEADADAQGLTGAARAAYFEEHKFDAAVTRMYEHLDGADGPAEGVHDVPSLIETAFTYHADIAEEWGLEMVAYEGGTHVVASWEYHDEEDDELNDFLMHFNYTDEMGRLYDRLLEGWKSVDGGVFVAFVGVEAPSKYGSWGHLRHLGDSNPRWDALIAARDGAAAE